MSDNGFPLAFVTVFAGSTNYCFVDDDGSAGAWHDRSRADDAANKAGFTVIWPSVPGVGELVPLVDHWAYAARVLGEVDGFGSIKSDPRWYNYAQDAADALRLLLKWREEQEAGS